MAEDLIQLSQEKYDKAGVYGNVSYGAGMASMFTKAMGSILDYSALKQELKNYDLQTFGTGLASQNVEIQATQMANKLRQSYIESAGNYIYNAARRGVAVSSGSVQSNLRRTSEELGKNVQDIQRNAEIEKKNLEMQAIAQQATKKIKKAQGKVNMLMNFGDIGFSAMEKMMFGAIGGGSAGEIEDMGGTKTNSAGTESFAKTVGIKPRR